MTDWIPLVADPEPIRTRLDAIEPALGVGVDALCDRALIADDPSELIEQALAAVGTSPELFGGAARVGWIVAHLAGGDIADEICASTDARLHAIVDSAPPGDHELVAGITGIGVYALERGNRELATAVLARLEATARARDHGIGWFTPASHVVAHRRAEAPDGYWDYGLAHGAAGVIALCARCVVAGIPRAEPLVDGAVTALLAAEPAATPRFPAWQAGAQRPYARLAWCYGDLGISLALYAAAIARDRADWRAEALAIARAAATRPDVAVDPFFCHGTAGIAHMFHRLYRATGEPVFASAARARIDELLARPIAGDDGTLLNGVIGVALVLEAAIADAPPAWDRLLLVDV